MSRLIAVAALLLCVSVGTASRPVAAQGAQDLASTLPDGPGRALVAAQCASCHSLDEAISKRTTTDRWRVTVTLAFDYAGGRYESGALSVKHTGSSVSVVRCRCGTTCEPRRHHHRGWRHR